MYSTADTQQRLPAEQSHWHPSTTLGEREGYAMATPARQNGQEHGQPAFDTGEKMMPQHRSHDRYGAPQQYLNYEPSAESQPPQQTNPAAGSPHWESSSAMTSSNYHAYYPYAATRGSSDFAAHEIPQAPAVYYDQVPASGPTETGTYYYEGEAYQPASTWYQGEEMQAPAPQETRVGNDFAMAHRTPSNAMPPAPSLAHVPSPGGHNTHQHRTLSPGSVDSDSSNMASLVPHFSPSTSSHSSPNSEVSPGSAAPGVHTHQPPHIYSQHRMSASLASAEVASLAISNAPQNNHVSQNPALQQHQHPSYAHATAGQHPASAHAHPSMIRRRSYDLEVHHTTSGLQGASGIPAASASPGLSSAHSAPHPAGSAASGGSYHVPPPTALPHPGFLHQHHTQPSQHQQYHHPQQHPYQQQQQQILQQQSPASSSVSSSASSSASSSLANALPPMVTTTTSYTPGHVVPSARTQPIALPSSLSSSKTVALAPFPTVEDFDYYASSTSQSGKSHNKGSARVVTQLYGLEAREAQAPQRAHKGSHLMSRSHGALPTFTPSVSSQNANDHLAGASTAPAYATASRPQPPTIAQAHKNGPTQFQFHPSPYMAYMEPPLKQQQQQHSGTNPDDATPLAHSQSTPSLPHHQRVANGMSPGSTTLITSPNSLERMIGEDLDTYSAKRVKWTESDPSQTHGYLASNQRIPTPNEADTPDTSSDTTSYWTPHT